MSESGRLLASIGPFESVHVFMCQHLTGAYDSSDMFRYKVVRCDTLDPKRPLSPLTVNVLTDTRETLFIGKESS